MAGSEEAGRYGNRLSADRDGWENYVCGWCQGANPAMCRGTRALPQLVYPA